MAALVVHAVLVQVFTYAFRPAVSYAVLEAGGSTVLLGVLGAVFALPALLLALPSGRLVDRLGERLAGAIGGTMLLASAVVALVGLRSLVALTVATVLLGCGHLLSVVSEQALVANRAQPGSRDSAFGMYTFVVSIGQTIGPVLIAIPAADGSGPALMVIVAICIGVAVGVTVSGALLAAARGDRFAPQHGVLDTAGRLVRMPGVFRALLSSSLALASVDITLAYWPALGHDRALPAWVVSAMLVARSLSTMLSRAALPVSVRLLGRRRLMIASLAIAAISLAGMAVPVASGALVALAALYGFAIGVSQPVTMSWLTDVAPPGERGMTMSVRLAGNRLGQSTVPALVGILAASAGAGGVLLATGAALIVASWASAAIDEGRAGVADGA